MPKNSKKSVIFSHPVNGMRAVKGMPTGMRKVSTAESQAVNKTKTEIMSQTAKYIQDKIEKIEMEKLD